MKLKTPKYLLKICLVISIGVTGYLQAEITPQPLSAKRMKQAYTKAYNYEQMGNYKDAINSLSIVYNAYPDAYLINLKIASVYLLNGNYANAEAHYLAAQKKSPTALSPALGLMHTANLRGQFNKTQELSYKVLKTDNHNYYANLYLAYALRMSEKNDAAMAVNLKMLEIYPDDATFLLEYALLAHQIKDYDKARSALNYVLALDPQNVAANELLFNLKD